MGLLVNIPFYRHVKYLDDGHELYQCLQCGENIDVGLPYYCFSPRFCCYCGVEYKGAILPKKEDWVYGSKPKKEKLLFVIQEATVWEGDEDKEIEWHFCSGYGVDRKQVVKDLKYHKDGEEGRIAKNKKSDYIGLKFKMIYRIVPQKGKAYPECFTIDSDKYYRKTGKKFNRSLYEKAE